MNNVKDNEDRIIIYHSQPIIRWLIDKREMEPEMFMFYCFVFGFLVQFVLLILVYNVTFSIGSQEDPINFFEYVWNNFRYLYYYGLLFFPVVAFILFDFYRYRINAIAKFFRHHIMEDNIEGNIVNVFGLRDRTSYSNSHDFLTLFKNTCNHKLVMLAGIGVALSSQVSMLLYMLSIGEFSEFDGELLVKVYSNLIIMPIMYLFISIFCIHAIIVIFYLIKLFWKNKILNLYLFPPEGKSGLEPIGELCLRFNLFFVLVAVGLAFNKDFDPGMVSFLEAPLLVLTIFLYLAVSLYPVIPLLILHRLMRDAKNRRLQECFWEFQQKTKVERNQVKLIDRTDKIYRLWKKKPTWPFPINMPIAFARTILVTLAPVYIEMIKLWVKGHIS
jgi:hypothetical protein